MECSITTLHVLYRHSANDLWKYICTSSSLKRKVYNWVIPHNQKFLRNWILGHRATYGTNYIISQFVHRATMFINLYILYSCRHVCWKITQNKNDIYYKAETRFSNERRVSARYINLLWDMKYLFFSLIFVHTDVFVGSRYNWFIRQIQVCINT